MLQRIKIFKSIKFAQKMYVTFGRLTFCEHKPAQSIPFLGCAIKTRPFCVLCFMKLVGFRVQN